MMHLTKYNFLQGHLSDFALSAELTCAIFSQKGDSKLRRILSVAVPATAFTIHEFVQPMYFQNFKTDPIDIACYWGGSIAAYLGIKAFGTVENREKIKEFIRKANPLKKAPALEDIIKS